MESIKNKWFNLPLRRFFILTVFISTGIVIVLSVIVILGCVSIRHWILPDSNAVYLTIEETLENGEVVTRQYLLEYGGSLESMFLTSGDNKEINTEAGVKKSIYSVQKVENSFDMLSPKRKLAYQICGMTIIAAPMFFAFIGIIMCSIYFYRRKLKQPLELLAGATDKIVEQNLDFEINYDCRDEMGDLCRSFEKMRNALHKNNKEMWQMIEERRLMQASVAHDLRNPIAIIEGYAEYLETGLNSGKMNSDKMCHVVQNLNMAAKRLEQYTESIRQLNQSEEVQLSKKMYYAPKLAESIAEDLKLLSEKNGISLKVVRDLPDEKIQADIVLIYRVLENLMNNAIRYAKKEILLEFTLSQNIFTITLIDDGEGFSDEILKGKEKLLLTSGKNGHMGIGLAVSRLLCKKHSGSLELSNNQGGACVKIKLYV